MSVQDLIDVAQNEVGYLEKETNSQLDSKTANAGDKNYTKYARDYAAWGFGNYQGQPWCDVFVSWCFKEAFDDDALVASHDAYCPYHALWFKNQGRWCTANPQIGDVIFFKDSSGAAVHTGIIYNIDKSKIYTIEGNTSSAPGVVANGGCVAQKSYMLNYSSILGFGRPNYPVESINTETTDEEIEMRYNTIAEVPAYAQFSVQKRIDAGALADPQNLDLSDDMIRDWVVSDRYFKKIGLLDDNLNLKI